MAAAAAVGNGGGGRGCGGCRVNWRRRRKTWRQVASCSVVEGDGAAAVCGGSSDGGSGDGGCDSEVVATSAAGKESGASLYAVKFMELWRLRVRGLNGLSNGDESGSSSEGYA
ncbi:hypothetical protein OsI_25412 [Oryza sativa Indica Group]|uniref:Uncharacterized protein n=1 Tax=Oryza sativa subsp. indica TaxID=39946 RepID=B8B8H1_ORYSI|nr:hypothetical protein OsI_25412 [Oryza sativa Indica Group]